MNAEAVSSTKTLQQIEFTKPSVFTIRAMTADPVNLALSRWDKMYRSVKIGMPGMGTRFKSPIRARLDADWS